MERVDGANLSIDDDRESMKWVRGSEGEEDKQFEKIKLIQYVVKIKTYDEKKR